ncbi:MAG: hypothetical protein K8T89_12010 [Planctomycetes bacterium]|nr:hypothetical protein [Planctomycetota bacterium]
MGNPNESSRRVWHIAWPFVLAANLIVPLGWGMDETRGDAIWGMVAAIPLFWLAGHGICAESRKSGSVLVMGGIVVALLQIVPILHITAGIVGVSLAAGPGMHKLTTFLGGFVATLITGGLLLLVALPFGMWVRMITHPLASSGE